MRVAHIIKATRISGAEKHLLILLQALRRKDVDAHLILLVEPRNLMTELVAEAEARDIPVQRVFIRAHYDVVVIARIRGALRELKPDIVHLHLIHADFLGLIAAKSAGVKTIITGRHNDDSFRNHPLIKRAHAVTWRMVDGGIAISQAIRQFVIDVESAPTDKVHVVEYGIEHHRLTDAQIKIARKDLRIELGLNDDVHIIGMAARLTEQKGITYALTAFAQISEEYPDVHLVIPGDGELKDALTAQAKQEGFSHRIHFLGWRDDVLQLMAGYDIFLQPSLWEGFGLVLLEAMSRRLPVVASRVSAIPEIIVHGETGLLTEAKNVTKIADALRFLLNDRTLRLHMGLNGEDRLEAHFSDLRMADETITVYEQLASK